MYAAVDWSATPLPEYHSDGLKKPGFYCEPPVLHDDLLRELGEFPLFDFWGPRAGIVSTRWIVNATLATIASQRPRLVLAYLPHLDYDHQRFGPDSLAGQARRAGSR